MNIIEPSAKLLLDMSGKEMLEKIERAARLCYKSEDKIQEGSAEKMVRGLIKSGHCYDGDTEILTEQGFIKFSDYKGQYKVATVNQNGSFNGFEMPNNLIGYNYTGKMYDYSGSLGYMTTAGHNMFGTVRSISSDATNYNYKLFKNDEIEYKQDNGNKLTNGERKFYTPTACRIPEDIDCWWELVGFWIGDGSRLNGNRLEFHLKKKRKIDYLINLATNLGIIYSIKKGNRITLTMKNIGNEFNSRYVRDKEKFLPHMEDPIKIKSIIKGLFNADGNKSNWSKNIGTTSSYVAEWLVNHGSLAGYTLYIGDVTKLDNIHWKPLYRVRIKANNSIIVNDTRKPDSKVVIINVDNLPVYCVQVSTGIIIVRGKNKIPSLCGNCAMIEHAVFSADIVCDRGISHEIVRHRLFSFAQSSTRYCNYSKGKFGSEITVIKPSGLKSPEDSDVAQDLNLYLANKAWEFAMRQSENAYMELLESGMSTDIARSVLPTCLATEIFVTGNVREWQHFFKLRTDSHAHPDMQIIAKDLLGQCQESIPILFDDFR